MFAGESLFGCFLWLTKMFQKPTNFAHSVSYIFRVLITSFPAHFSIRKSQIFFYLVTQLIVYFRARGSNMVFMTYRHKVIAIKYKLNSDCETLTQLLCRAVKENICLYLYKKGGLANIWACRALDTFIID